MIIFVANQLKASKKSLKILSILLPKTPNNGKSNPLQERQQIISNYKKKTR